MYIHTQKETHLDRLLAAIEDLDAGALDRLQAAVDRRRGEIGGSGSVVVERRGHLDGELQLETRAYRRKDGGLTERGPYWYFHHREGGRQRTVYVGKTDDPEAALEKKLGRR